MSANPSLLVDHYELEPNAQGQSQPISSDGTGTTYRARDTRTDQPVILRIFSERLLGDSSIQKEFVRHAKLVIELDHPGLTRIVDTGQHGNQFFYVLSDPGGQTVEEHVESSGPFEVAHALRLHSHLSEALMAVRTQPGLMSRVWPRNLLVSGSPLESKIHLIAQNLITQVDPPEQPEYLAPEILAGHPDSAQATLYSIGATLYYMLTGQPPYPSGLKVEDLLELKSTTVPDISALPHAAPGTLLRLLLESDPRNRPKSLMEWDRALQRFIRFTPTDTSAITVDLLSEPEEAKAKIEPQEAPKPKEASKSVTPFVISEPAASDSETIPVEELQKAKVHTQRLSLELTKRVQKELALTERLKGLEAELEEERVRAEAATKKPDPTDPKIEEERRKLQDEWKSLEDARQVLKKEKNDFLEETQRFSIAQLQAQAAAETAADTETQRVLTKPRIFRFSRKPKATVTPPATTAKPELVERTDTVTAKPELFKKKSTEIDLETTIPTKIEPQRTDKPRKATTERPAARETTRSTSTPNKPAEIKTPQALRSSSKPVIDKPQVPRAREPIAANARTDTSKVVTFVKPETLKPLKNPEPVGPKKKPVAPRNPEGVAPPVPSYEPLPGAWLALAILGLVIGVGLFLAYRTFFSKQENYLLGSLRDNGPKVIELTPDESANGGEPTPGGSISRSLPTAKADHETQVNEEIRVDMKAFENFLLLQDQEWAELLHSMKNLERQESRYKPQELYQIRRELFDDLERSAQLKKEDLRNDAGFVELYDYLKPLVNTAEETPASETETATVTDP